VSSAVTFAKLDTKANPASSSSRSCSVAYGWRTSAGGSPFHSRSETSLILPMGAPYTRGFALSPELRLARRGPAALAGLHAAGGERARSQAPPRGGRF
jgi:hypothetical protein